MKRYNIFIIIMLSISYISYAQESSENIIYFSYNYLLLNYDFLPVKDNITDQITEHFYSKSYNYSLKIGYTCYKKINYGIYLNYSSFGYRLNYKFDALEYDPYLLKYSIIYSKYIGFNSVLGKCVFMKNRFKINTNVFIENNFLIQNYYKNIFNNDEYTKSSNILYQQHIKNYLPVAGINLDFEKKILKRVYASINTSFFYSIKKISDVSINKNKIQFSIAINLGYGF